MYPILMLKAPKYLLPAFLLLSTLVSAQESSVYAAKSSSMIRFTENKGQWDDLINYRAQLDGGALYLQKAALTYSFYDKDAYRSNHMKPSDKNPEVIKTTGFNVKFENSNKDVVIESSNASKDRTNYFIGKDRKHWASGAKNYQRVLYKNLWKDVNLEAIGQDNSVKYNFYVKPGASPSVIQMHYDKVKRISLHKKELIIKTIINELIEHEPYAYQLIGGKEVTVPCNYVLKDNTVSFVFPNGYNKNYELVIDPVLVFACSSGSLADNFGMTATYDNNGNLYSGGTAFDVGFPVVNAYDSTYNGIVQYGRTDVVITKYDSAGTFLHYSTYIGGATGSEIVTSIIVDAGGNLFLYGATGSTDFPITAQAYDASFNGGQYLFFSFNGTKFSNGTDIYVAKLNPGGDQLLASTYLGGSKNDGVNISNDVVTTTYPFPVPNCANVQQTSGQTVTEPRTDSLQYNYGDQYRGEIQLDNFGYPIINSSSRSSDFPTVNAYDNTLGGWQDAVVVKLDPNLSQIVWSTFVGGSNNDAGYALCIGKNNEVYTTGGTRSNDFPTSTGVYNQTYNGGKCDGYITKLSPSGNSLLAATYIGTNDYDQSYFIQLDKNQNVYVFGQSLGNMPILNVGYSKPNSKQFISKLNTNLTSLLFSTVIGNGNGLINLSPAAFSVDYCENIYLSGWGGNIIKGPRTDSMPMLNAIQSSNPDGFNFYLMSLSKNCSSLLFGSYFGGSCSHEHVDGGTSRFDKRGIIYQSVCAGCGAFSDFPVSNPAWWPRPQYGTNWNQSNNCNNGTFKIDFKIPLVTANYSANTSGCAPLTVHFSNLSSNDSTFLWDFGGGNTSTQSNPVITYPNPGSYTVHLIANGGHNACNVSDTSIIYITVFPKPQASFTPVYDSCANSVSFQNNSNAGTLNYNWNLGNGQTSTDSLPGTISYQVGTYTATLVTTNSFGCIDSIKKPLIFTLIPYNSYPDTAICKGGSIQLTASGGLSYSWQPAAGLNNSASPNPIATPTTTTIYSVTIHQVDGAGHTCDHVLTDTIKIYPKVTANFSYVVNNCGNTLQFTDSSYTVVNSWDWNFGDGVIDSIKNPSHSYSATGTYTITLVADNQYGCKDSTKKTVTLTGFNPISISAGSYDCKNAPVQLNASGGIAYQWSPASSLNNSTISNPIATPTTTTQYTVLITQVAGTNTCIATLHTSITVPTYSTSILTAFAHPDTIYAGQTTQLGTLTSGGTIVWSPNYNISNVNDPNPTAWPGHTTTYTAMYTDPHGCTFPISSVTIYVIAKDCNENTVFVPNTFTPNADGVNDVLFARSNLITEIHFVIADRWGQIVFETNDITKGWDGVFNGKPCNPDVFGYFITYKCNNGKESFKKGNVTLIR